MQRLFIGLLCFSVLYIVCGCAAFKDSSSSSVQESPTQQKSEAKAPDTISGTLKVCPLDSVACVPENTSLAVAPDKAAPVVQLPETSFDFGIMNENREFVHKFQIKNAGSSDLIIKKIIPG